MAAPATYAANYRGNPCLVVRYRHPDGSWRHFSFDAGKSFNESVNRWLPRYGVPTLDAVVLTHGHADAVLGLDDLRGLQPFRETGSNPPIHVFADAATRRITERVFPYLHTPADAIRKVASLKWDDIQPGTAFQPCGSLADDNLSVTPVTVLHGEDLESLGFVFGRRHRVVYLSDVSRIPDATMAAITAHPVDVLITDALFLNKDHPTHMSLPQAMDVIDRIKPRLAFTTGMTDQLDWAKTNAALAARFDGGPTFARAARDGLRVPVTL